MACNRIHTSGEPPNRRATFRHITADNGLRPARMPCSIWRDTLKALAAAVTDSPTEGRISSLIISPGWTGGSPFLLSMTSSLVVVLKIDIQSVFARPPERNAIVPGYAHRPAFRGAWQAVEVKACDVHVLRPSRHFQQLQDAHAFPDMIGADAAGFAGAVKLLQAFLPAALGHLLV